MIKIFLYVLLSVYSLYSCQTTEPSIDALSDTEPSATESVPRFVREIAFNSNQLTLTVIVESEGSAITESVLLERFALERTQALDTIITTANQYSQDDALEGEEANATLEKVQEIWTDYLRIRQYTSTQQGSAYLQASINISSFLEALDPLQLSTEYLSAITIALSQYTSEQ